MQGKRWIAPNWRLEAFIVVYDTTIMGMGGGVHGYPYKDVESDISLTRTIQVISPLNADAWWNADVRIYLSS